MAVINFHSKPSFLVLIILSSCQISTPCNFKPVKDGMSDLSDSLKIISFRLASSMDKGVETIAKTVLELRPTIEAIAKQIRFDTGDLAHIGKDATANLKEALIEISKNWKLAVDTADLEKIGASAAQALSEALQNINVHIRMEFQIDDNLRRSIKYISIALGVAFSVLLVAIVVSLRKCRAYTASFFKLCFNAENKNKSENEYEDECSGDLEPPLLVVDMKGFGFSLKPNMSYFDKCGNNLQFNTRGLIKLYCFVLQLNLTGPQIRYLLMFAVTASLVTGPFTSLVYNVNEVHRSAKCYETQLTNQHKEIQYIFKSAYADISSHMRDYAASWIKKQRGSFNSTLPGSLELRMLVNVTETAVTGFLGELNDAIKYCQKQVPTRNCSTYYTKLCYLYRRHEHQNWREECYEKSARLESIGFGINSIQYLNNNSHLFGEMANYLPGGLLRWNRLSEFMSSNDLNMSYYFIPNESNEYEEILNQEFKSNFLENLARFQQLMTSLLILVGIFVVIGVIIKMHLHFRRMGQLILQGTVNTLFLEDKLIHFGKDFIMWIMHCFFTIHLLILDFLLNYTQITRRSYIPNPTSYNVTGSLKFIKNIDFGDLLQPVNEMFNNMQSTHDLKIELKKPDCRGQPIPSTSLETTIIYISLYTIMGFTFFLYRFTCSIQKKIVTSFFHTVKQKPTLDNNL